MHPPEFHAADGDHPAERKLFEALRDSLPDPWEAFHSIDWLERDPAEGARVGEVDFVLCHPNEGIVCLEVKGGGIECRHGAWRRRKPSGEWEPMKDPVKQVRDNQFALERLLKRTPEWSIEKPFMSHGLAFPLSSVHQLSLGPGTDPQIIIDRSDMASVEAGIERILAYHRGARDKRSPLGEEGVEGLVDLLAPSVEIRVPLGETLMEEEAALESLTREQSRLLLRMRRDPRMVITGCAGSGKTMLAVAHAHRLAREGNRVLFACFNKKLRDDLRARYGIDGLAIENVHGLATQLARKAGLSMPKGDWNDLGDEFWNGALPDAIVEACAVLDVQYEALMIDEAQDLDNRWLDSLTCLLSDPATSPVWLFMDDSQNVYGSKLDVPDEYRPFELTVNCRNTQAIHREVVKKYTGLVEPEVLGPEGRAPELVHTDHQAGAVAEALERLCGREEVLTRDVVVLSSHGTTNSRLYNDGLPGRFALTDARPAPAGRVLFSSIRGFKGLESSVVVLCELEGLPDETLDQQLYVGLSRAKTHCVVIAPPSAAASASAAGE
jgi:hypothetical protein